MSVSGAVRSATAITCCFPSKTSIPPPLVIGLNPAALDSNTFTSSSVIASGNRSDSPTSPPNRRNTPSAIALLVNVAPDTASGTNDRSSSAVLPRN